MTVVGLMKRQIERMRERRRKVSVTLCLLFPSVSISFSAPFFFTATLPHRRLLSSRSPSLCLVTSQTPVATQLSFRELLHHHSQLPAPLPTNPIPYLPSYSLTQPKPKPNPPIPSLTPCPSQVIPTTPQQHHTSSPPSSSYLPLTLTTLLSPTSSQLPASHHLFNPHRTRPSPAKGIGSDW
ncbi:hypothetical protein BZA05DRAFT_173870 [Tricharina praecox]|uniref:uncharacterized protein n=1 Tax=Tricharina praecox TaxID=43433 RepID=UPI002220DF83|nr:uncharacterized protein BZA05DRAFT_173870 [Tricharina praecox]KAI5844315.1 hypothetical protein BZA05DRAFT_173870 [Tricharina praecox]